MNKLYLIIKGDSPGENMSKRKVEFAFLPNPETTIREVAELEDRLNRMSDDLTFFKVEFEWRTEE